MACASVVLQIWEPFGLYAQVMSATSKIRLNATGMKFWIFRKRRHAMDLVLVATIVVRSALSLCRRIAQNFQNFRLSPAPTRRGPMLPLRRQIARRAVLIRLSVAKPVQTYSHRSMSSHQ